MERRTQYWEGNTILRANTTLRANTIFRGERNCERRCIYWWLKWRKLCKCLIL
jgi:hypothetical protein